MRFILVLIIFDFLCDNLWADVQVHGFLNKAAFENLSSNPSCAVPANCPFGRVYWNTSVGEPRMYDGSSWQEVIIGIVPYSKMSFSNNIVAADMAPNSIGVSEMADNAVVGGAGGTVQDNSLTFNDLGTGSVRESEIDDSYILDSNSNITCFGGTNVNDCTVSDEKFIRVGDHVTFAFRIQINPNVQSGLSECSVNNFPHATSFDSVFDLNGVCALATDTTVLGGETPVGTIFAETGGDDADLRILSVPHTDTRNWLCTGMYHIE